MTQKELLDFLHSYKIMITLENENWKAENLSDNIMRLNWNITEIICKIMVTIECEKNITIIKITANDDFTWIIVEELYEMIIEEEFDFEYSSVDTMNKNYWGMIITLKADHKIAKETFLYCIKNIENLVNSINKD